MVLGSPPSPSSGADGSPRRKVHRVAMLAAVLGLVACNPVETWRDWSGASKNDPDPETARNTQNLAAGEAADYPNLASVPPPPNRALFLSMTSTGDNQLGSLSNAIGQALFSATTPRLPPVSVTLDRKSTRHTIRIPNIPLLRLSAFLQICRRLIRRCYLK